jgi:hypothetical protein
MFEKPFCDLNTTVWKASFCKIDRTVRITWCRKLYKPECIAAADRFNIRVIISSVRKFGITVRIVTCNDIFSLCWRVGYNGIYILCQLFWYNDIYVRIADISEHSFTVEFWLKNVVPISVLYIYENTPNRWNIASVCKWNITVFIFCQWVGYNGI